MRACLTIDSGQGSPSCIDLDPRQLVTIGRHPNNLVVVPDRQVSRWHAEIVQHLDNWVLRAVDARNGIRLDGEPLLRSMPLRHGQVITIGNARLLFSLESGQRTPVLSSSAATTRVSIPEPSSAPDSVFTRLASAHLEGLCELMVSCSGLADPRAVIRACLEFVHGQTQATFAGYLNLHPDDPLLKVVHPEQAQGDKQLSRRLTQEISRSGRAICLRADGGAGATSDSLSSFADALGIPVGKGEGLVGALHVYKAAQLFAEEERALCVVVAGFLAGMLKQLRASRVLEAENSRLRGQAPVGDELVGDSPHMRQLRESISRIAQRSGLRPAPVLIEGESGVGKELVAWALHRQSPRHVGPLVVVNSAAISTSLLEAELFGYRRGAFTGATQDYPGLFQQADEGTLFLDEVGDLSPECQASLLRVIEGKPFRPVGATVEVVADVRIVTATHRNLEEDVKAGRFREDLFFRLRALRIAVPALREHLEDVPQLVDYFLRKLVVQCNHAVTISPGAIRRLQGHCWPGNVRELRSTLEHAVILGSKNVIEAEDLPLPGQTREAGPADLNLEHIEAATIREAFEQSNGNVSLAARRLGICRDTLYERMRKYGIRLDSEV